jgi:hypothetical protein
MENRLCHPDRSEVEGSRGVPRKVFAAGFLDFAQNDDRYRKNREGNKFSSRVEVRVVTPKKFGALIQRRA